MLWLRQCNLGFHNFCHSYWRNQFTYCCCLICCTPEDCQKIFAKLRRIVSLVSTVKHLLAESVYQCQWHASVCWVTERDFDPLLPIVNDLGSRKELKIKTVKSHQLVIFTMHIQCEYHDFFFEPCPE